jgi:phage-related protein
MGKVVCRYFVTRGGRVPVREFIAGLDPRSRRKFFYIAELLEENGWNLSLPHVRYIGDDVFELRFESVEGAVRVLYFFYHQDSAILTNGFIKKTDQTPRNEKMTALERRLEFLQRHLEENT